LALTADDAYVDNIARAPVFNTPLSSIGVEEGQFCRFETQLAPFNDPYMRIEWYKDGKPILIGKFFVCLNLHTY
jgi:hypothetical protein